MTSFPCKRLNRVRECPNAWKVVASRLQVNGVRAAGGHDISLPCACGWTPPAEADTVARALACKAHVFGDCGVAKAVIEVLRESLPAHLSPLLQPADVWLLRLPPHPQPSALNVDAWSLTCALALHSIQLNEGMPTSIPNATSSMLKPEPATGQ